MPSTSRVFHDFAQWHEWHAVLSFHGAVLQEIERGLLK